MPAQLGNREETVGGHLREILDSAAGEVALVCPHRELLAAVVSADDDATLPDELLVVTHREAANDAREQFPLATRLADLTERDAVSLHVTQAKPLRDAVCITPTRVVALLSDLVPETGGIETTDGVDEFRRRFHELWEETEPYTFDAPAYSRLLASMDDELIDGMGEDFASVMASTAQTRGSADLDVVAMLLLLGGKHGCQFYRVSRWGEKMGIGSTSKFSKEKRRLENTGLIETVAVDRDTPGRPRDCLRLADRLRNMDATELRRTLQTVYV